MAVAPVKVCTEIKVFDILIRTSLLAPTKALYITNFWEQMWHTVDAGNIELEGYHETV